MNQNEEYQVIKLFIVGDRKIGKTSSILRFCDDFFIEDIVPFQILDFKIKKIKIDDKNIRLQIFDSKPPNRYEFPDPNRYIYRGVDIVLLMYDITKYQSFLNIKQWHSEVQRYCKDNIMVNLVGTNLDIVEFDNGKREVGYDLAKSYANHHDMEFIETSSKYNINLDQCYLNAMLRVYRNNNSDSSIKNNDNIINKNNDPPVTLFNIKTIFLNVYNKIKNK